MYRNTFNKEIPFSQNPLISSERESESQISSFREKFKDKLKTYDNNYQEDFEDNDNENFENKNIKNSDLKKYKKIENLIPYEISKLVFLKD